MDEATKKEAIAKVALLIEQNYVFLDLAKRLSETLLKNYIQQSYSRINNSYDFANVLNEDIRHLTNDKHLHVSTDVQLINSLKSETTESRNRILYDWERSLNYGFSESRILDSDVGYLKLDSFSDTEIFPEATAIAEQTMNFFGNAQAIIFDLRENAGGSPRMIQLLSSYLFEGEPVHLNSFYSRETDSETETWTLSNIEGRKYPNARVFILTSEATFSAAEEFTYNLHNLKRATIIGEVTGGGAHPGDFHLVSEYHAIFVPSGRAINPITRTNWEGVGVQPDIEVSAEDALDVALQIIRKNDNLTIG